MRKHSAVKLAWAGFLAMAAAIGIGRFAYTPILPAMVDGLSWSASDAGLVASANFLGYLLGAAASARPIAPERQRNWLLAALLISTLTTLGMSFGDNFATFIALRLLGGGASAYVIVLASTVVLNGLPSSQRPSLSAIHFSGVGAGIMISAAAVSALQRAGAPWRMLWTAIGTIALLATVLVAMLIKERAISSPTHLAPKASGNGGGLPALIAAYGLFGFGYVITATFLVTIVRMTPEIHSMESWIWILFGFAAIPSVALWSWIGARIGFLYALAIACLTEAAGVAASVESATLFGICIAAILLGGTFMGITALGVMAAQQISNADPQRAIGLMTASFATGQMIGPTAAGFVSDWLGSFRFPSLAAAFALVLAAALCVVARRNASAD